MDALVESRTGGTAARPPEAPVPLRDLKSKLGYSSQALRLIALFRDIPLDFREGLWAVRRCDVGRLAAAAAELRRREVDLDMRRWVRTAPAARGGPR